MPTKKSVLTSRYIIKTVAPIFNKKGYTATSMRDIVEATGLTKGAIYGNFVDKEDLAIQAFRYNIRIVVQAIWDAMKSTASPVERLFVLTSFYRSYPELTGDLGGCPILNIGIDANPMHPLLIKRVRGVILKLQYYIARIIYEGIELGEIKVDIDPDRYAGRIFAMIEGAVFMWMTMGSEEYLLDMMDQVDTMLRTELIL